MIAALTQDPGFVIESQTFKIIRLEGDLRRKDREIAELKRQHNELESNFYALQRELVVEKSKKVREVKRKDFSQLPVKVRKPIKELLRPDDIKKAVSDHYGYKFKQLTEKGKRHDVVVPRHWICYFLYNHTYMGYPDIGKMFNRHHTTIMNAVAEIQKVISLDVSMHDTLLAKIKSKTL